MDKAITVVIPARNEMFLSETIEDIFKHAEGEIEVIAVLDGAPAVKPLPTDPRLTVLENAEPKGQRAATNQAVRLAKHKYIIKCDAHCAFDQGFDVKLVADMQDDWTVVPIMRNLHAFNWVCPDGHTRYQGPSGPCKDCGKPTTRDIVWIAKESPQSKAYCFDAEPHFQYFKEFSKRPEGQGDLTETMSLQGSFFMLTKDKYWELNICDEEFGSWGSQGIEVAVKTWLSGGRVVVNQKTWYAHMFRTQGGDFSFPYRQHHSKVLEGRKFARELFFDNKWPLQKLPLSWLLEKFAPVPGWSEEQLAPIKEWGEKFYKDKGIKKGIIFYTDNQLNLKLAHAVQNQLRSIGLPIISTSLKPMSFGHNIVVEGERGYATMFKQILTALEASTADIIYFCEHDVLYHPSHFDFTPEKKDMFYYNQNFWKIWKDGKAAHWDANQVSGLCCYRDHAIAFYRERLKEIESGFDRSYEPGGRDATKYETWKSQFPNYDFRGENNLTRSHRSPESFRDKSTCIGWEETTTDKLPVWDGAGAIIRQWTA